MNKRCCMFSSFFVVVILVSAQTNFPITEPQLLSVQPINSTALTVSWQFANATYDQSDLIRISIVFTEFFYNYNQTYSSIDLTFTTTNKTINSLTQNFQLVNAFYYVCFSSNSTRTNSSEFVFNNQCVLTRTCSRLTSSSCSSRTSFIVISSSALTSNSFLLTVNWLKNLPYVRNSTSVQLINNAISPTALPSIDNNTYFILPYQFSNLQSMTNYTVNVSTTYSLFGSFFTSTDTVSIVTSAAAPSLPVYWTILCFCFFLISRIN